jgi:hypothetical protein
MVPGAAGSKKERDGHSQSQGTEPGGKGNNRVVSHGIASKAGTSQVLPVYAKTSAKTDQIAGETVA